MSRLGAVVCGGVVRDLIIGDTPKDIDCFVNYKDGNKWFRLLREAGFKQCRRRFQYGDIIVDIIQTKRRSAKSIISRFDNTAAQWFIHNDKFIPLNNKVYKLTIARKTEFKLSKDLFGTSKDRMQRLISKGWECIGK